MNNDPSMSCGEIQLTPERVVRVLRLCGLASEGESTKDVITAFGIPSEEELRFLGADVASVVNSMGEVPTADELQCLEDVNLFHRLAS